MPREDAHHAEPYLDLPLKHFSHQLSRKRSKSAQRFAAPANSAEGSAENFLPGSNSLLSGYAPLQAACVVQRQPPPCISWYLT